MKEHIFKVEYNYLRTLHALLLQKFSGFDGILQEAGECKFMFHQDLPERSEVAAVLNTYVDEACPAKKLELKVRDGKKLGRELRKELLTDDVCTSIQNYSRVKNFIEILEQGMFVLAKNVFAEQVTELLTDEQLESTKEKLEKLT